MKITSLQSFGALAFIGLGVSLSSTNLFAYESKDRCEHRGGEHRTSHREVSHREVSRCSRLPHNARTVSYRGESCWESGGRYYRKHALGGYEIIDQPVETETVVVERPIIRKEVVVEKKIVTRPVVEEQVVEQPVVEKEEVAQPVVEEQQTQVVEQPVVEEAQAEDSVSLEEDDTVVETLPDNCQTVTVDGETCWENNGTYYRKCNGGYRVCHRSSSKKGHVTSKGSSKNDKGSVAKNDGKGKTSTATKKGNPTGDSYGPGKASKTEKTGHVAEGKRTESRKMSTSNKGTTEHHSRATASAGGHGKEGKRA